MNGNVRILFIAFLICLLIQNYRFRRGASIHKLRIEAPILPESIRGKLCSINEITYITESFTRFTD